MLIQKKDHTKKQKWRSEKERDKVAKTKNIFVLLEFYASF